jgi:hypothetical protein
MVGTTVFYDLMAIADRLDAQRKALAALAFDGPADEQKMAAQLDQLYWLHRELRTAALQTLHLLEPPPPGCGNWGLPW